MERRANPSTAPQHHMQPVLGRPRVTQISDEASRAVVSFHIGQVPLGPHDLAALVDGLRQPSETVEIDHTQFDVMTVGDRNVEA